MAVILRYVWVVIEHSAYKGVKMCFCTRELSWQGRQAAWQFLVSFYFRNDVIVNAATIIKRT